MGGQRLYAQFYGLDAEPFSLSPDPRFCYRHPSFARAKAYFQFAIHRGEGFVMVTGRPGTGKTTLIQDLVRDLSKSSLLVARIDRTQVEADDLLRLVAFAFGIDARGADKASLLHDIEHLLRRRAGPRNRAILIVDEAQNLPPAALEELRLITNLHDRMVPLVQIFLVGQEELRTTIRAPRLEQLHQRIVAACHIEPLGPEEMRGYIHHRLLCAGWRGDPQIRGEALALVHVATRGIPRLVNKLCDRLLVHASIEGRHVLRAEDAQVVVSELRQEYLTPEDAPLGDLLRKGGGVPALADLVFERAEVGPVMPPPSPRSVSPEQPAAAGAGESEAEEPDASLTDAGRQTAAARGAAQATPELVPLPAPSERVPSPLPRSAPDTRRPPRRRRRWPWAAAAGLILAAGSGYGLLGPQRVAELKQTARASVDRLAERWWSAWETGGRQVERSEARVAPAARVTAATADREVTPWVPLGSLTPAPQRPPADDLAGSDVAAAPAPAVAGDADPGPAPEPLAAQLDAEPSPAVVTVPIAAPETESLVPAEVTARPVVPEQPALPSTREEPPAERSTFALAEDRPTERLPATGAAVEPAGASPQAALARPTGEDLALVSDAPAHGVPPVREGRADASEDPRPEPGAQPDLAAVAEALEGLGLRVAQRGTEELRLDLVGEVRFAVDRADIPASSLAILRDLAGILSEHPSTRVRVIGHTDRSGPAEHNLALSRRRAEAVRDQLARDGVAPDRLVAEGRGMEEPLLAEEGAPVFRRRVELRIEVRQPGGPGTAAKLEKTSLP